VEEGGCPVKSGPLGTDYAAAVRRAEEILLPALDAWRSAGTASASSRATATFLTLDWLFGEYRADRRFTKLDAKTRHNHEAAFKLVGGCSAKNTWELSTPHLSMISTTGCL
jgi:hypothetical protein